jgi:hypothetical protein
MNYSLGNMLSNGGALNPDGLALDLQFAADKTLTARKGPTPAFTRASTATFVGSNGLIQSAAINTPRFDHNSVTLASRGLLIEEARTNLVLQSENHPSASWSKTGATVASASNTAPNGSSTSNLVTEDSSTGVHRLFQSTAYVSGTSYSISVFLKYAGRQFVAITHPAVASNGTAIFDIQNGTITLTQSGITSSITAYANGWYRCVINGVSATTGGSSHIIQGSTTGNVLTGSYTGLNGAAFYIYGSQVEAGSFPTSYIPTTTASVVRSADVCSITGSDFSGFYNQSEGAMFANAFTPASGDRTVLAVDDNTANEMIRLRTETANPFFKVTDGGSEVVAIDAGTVTANTAFKLIGAYKVNDFASSINGGSAVTDTTGTIPTVDRMRIGAGQGGNTMCGCVSAIRYFKKRLPDTKLQSLTA